MKTHISEYASKNWVLEQNFLTNNTPTVITNLIFKDRTTETYHQVYIDNNQITSVPIDCLGIVVSQLPYKLSYMDEEEFNPEGMIVKRVNVDNTLTEITDYTYDATPTPSFVISYIDKVGNKHTAIIELTITVSTPELILQDFDYITNDDGTYTLIDWNNSRNGITSTELIIPNKTYIIL